MWRAAIVAVVAVCAASAAQAQTPDDPVGRVLLRASSAFEYRDFDKVVEILGGWVHPPRIADPALMLQARRLLGISLHIQGDDAGAREEFGQVLLAKPDLQLDPFVVPPAVIETFEDVRLEMKPVLDRIRAERAGGTVQVAPKRAPGAPHPLIAYLPFGLAQMIVLDQVEWGATWMVVQMLGLAANIVGFYLAASLRNDDGFLDPAKEADFDQRLAIQYSGIAVFGAAWLISGIQGHVALEARADPGSAAGLPGQDRPVYVGITFRLP